jgi:hypothetical protein
MAALWLCPVRQHFRIGDDLTATALIGAADTPVN